MNRRMSGLLLLGVLCLASTVTHAAVSSDRQRQFEKLAEVQSRRGDRDGAIWMRELGKGDPVVPKPLSEAAATYHEVYAPRYESLREKVRRALLDPRHAKVDAWKVWRAEADLHLISYELEQDREAAISLVQTWLADASAMLEGLPISADPSPSKFPPPVLQLSAEPMSIHRGGRATLKWSAANATEVRMAGEKRDTEGTLRIKPRVTTAYELTAIGPGGSTNAAVVVTVTDPDPDEAGVPRASIAATPSHIEAGAAALLRWKATNAAQVWLDGAPVEASGSRLVTPKETRRYEIVAHSEGGHAEASTLVTVMAIPSPMAAMKILPPRISAGESAMLFWRTVRAETVLIDGARVPAEGRRVIAPAASTAFDLEAWGPGGRTTASAAVAVEVEKPSTPSAAVVTPAIAVQGGDHRYRIHVDFRQTAPDSSAQSVIEHLVKLLKDDPKLRVRIEGHTDAVGGDAFNLRLSVQRATAARNWIVRKHRIPAARFTVKGLGESAPIAPNQHPDGRDNPEGRKMNRRVEFILVR